MSSELKVGLMLVAAVVLMVTFTVFTTPSLQPKGAYTVQFPRVARLKAGDPVTFNGVQVGKVSGVEPLLNQEGNATVQVRFSIDSSLADKVRVGDRSTYNIRQGILGGAELEIISATGKPITPEALQNVLGAEPASIDEVFRSIQTLVDENRAGVKKAVDEFGRAGTNVADLSKHLDEVVAENRDQLKTTMKNLGDAGASINVAIEENRENLRGAIDNFKIMAKQIGELVEENRPAVQKAIGEFGRASSNVADVAKRLDDVVIENRESFKQTLDGFAALGKRLDAISANVDTITAQIAQGKGTLGKLVMDDAIGTKVEQVLDNANQRLEEVKPLTSGLSEVKFYVGLAGGYNGRAKYSSGEAYLRVEPRPWKFYEGGVTYRGAPAKRDTKDDDPDKLSIDFNLKFGWRFFRDDDAQLYRLTIAGGVYETRIGGEIMAPITHSLSVHAMARQKHNTRTVDDRRYEHGHVLYRGWLEWQVWGRVSLIAGVDDWEKPGPWIGVRGELRDDDIRNLSSAAALGR